MYPLDDEKKLNIECEINKIQHFILRNLKVVIHFEKRFFFLLFCREKEKICSRLQAAATIPVQLLFKVKMRNNRAAEDIIDAQNRERQERLANKSSFLKSLAYDIESEAKDHNRLLDNVDGDFDRLVHHIQRAKCNYE